MDKIDFSKPNTLMITFCIVLSITFAAFYYFSRKAVIRYRKTLELYQTFMS